MHVSVINDENGRNTCMSIIFHVLSTKYLCIRVIFAINIYCKSFISVNESNDYLIHLLHSTYDTTIMIRHINMAATTPIMVSV